ncbi:MAG: undecaprenyl-diphosphate phosphatase [Myxococcota bacterium]
MDTLETLLLGVLQGLTEFLPVSSSGHIAVLAWVFGIEEAGLSLAIVLHLGTLLATLLVFRADVLQLLRTSARTARRPSLAMSEHEDVAMLRAIAIGTLPALLVGLTLKDAVEALGRSPAAIGGAFLGTATLLLVTRREKDEGREGAPSARDALLIGLAQAVAIAPGVSRSGSTIAVALLLGIGSASAFRFSFLLSLPAVGGAALLLLLDASRASVSPNMWLGGLIAFVVGILALLALRGVVQRGRLWWFALYLVPLGLGLLAYGAFG